MLQSRIDRDVLPLSDEEADRVERLIEREWKLFWGSKDCSLDRKLTGDELMRVAYNQEMVKGDCFILATRRKKSRNAYDTCLQLVEADRISNPEWQADTSTMAGGVQSNSDGVPIFYHILESHPGSTVSDKKYKWKAYPAYGKELGLSNVLHCMTTKRPNQSRGIPRLAPVIEELKQLCRATKNELMATTISSLFTVFLETEQSGRDNGINADALIGETGGQSTEEDLKLGNGLIMELPPGVKVHDSNPGRPNVNFDPFHQAIVRQVGAGVGIPAEIIMKTFNKSHSASKAAMLEAWRHFSVRRNIVADRTRIIFEIFFYEAVSKGRIAAPGFFTDQSIRAAYLSADFIGPPKGQINGMEEVRAARERISEGISNRAIESAELGRDWDKMHAQSVKEQKARVAGGLAVEIITEEVVNEVV